MSFNFGKTEEKGKTNQKQDPWAPTIPALTDYIGELGKLDTSAPSGTQIGAANELSDIYGKGNQFTGALSNLANDMFTGVDSNSDMSKEAYATLQKQLSPYAEGKNLDFNSNPYLQQMLSTVGDSVQERINAQFAGAGRDLSGMNQQSIGRGVTQAQLPLLLDQFNKEQANQMNAANALYGAGQTTAQTAQGLDQAALNGRAGALPVAQAATDASLWGPQGQFNLDQIMGEIPFQKLGMLGNLLLPVAQLGQQQAGTSSSSGTSFGLGAKLLSDERLKENIEEIGTMADGTPMVRFNYKGETTTRIGVRAQDVEELTPEAVSEYAAPQAGTDDGMVKYVDMDAATRRSADMMKNGGMLDGPEGGMAVEPAMPPPMPAPMLDEEPWMKKAA